MHWENNAKQVNIQSYTAPTTSLNFIKRYIHTVCSVLNMHSAPGVHTGQAKNKIKKGGACPLGFFALFCLLAHVCHLKWDEV